jgi:hypothetical protein
MAAEDSSTFGLLKTLLQPPPARPSRLQRLLPCSGTMPALLEPKRRLSAKLSARGAALSTAAILLRDVGHAFKVLDRVVINIGSAAKD